MALCTKKNWIAVILQLQILCFTCLQCAFMHMSFVFGCTLKNELSFSTVLLISLSLFAKSLRSFKYLFSKIKSLPLLCILCGCHFDLCKSRHTYSFVAKLLSWVCFKKEVTVHITLPNVHTVPDFNLISISEI